MRRILIFLLLPVLVACNGSGTPLPSPPTPEPVPPTSAPPTVVPDPPTPTQVPATNPPPDTTTFPSPDAYAWQPIVSGLQRPVDLQADGSGRLFVIEKPGRIRIIQSGLLLETPFLNISDRVNDRGNEMGLLGLAFHPNYSQNGFFFVNYTGSGGDTFISRFRVTGDPNVADPDSEVNLGSPVFNGKSGQKRPKRVDERN